MDLAGGPVGGDALVMQVSSVLKVRTWWTPAPCLRGSLRLQSVLETGVYCPANVR